MLIDIFAMVSYRLLDQQAHAVCIVLSQRSTVASPFGPYALSRKTCPTWSYLHETASVSAEESLVSCRQSMLTNITWWLNINRLQDGVPISKAPPEMFLFSDALKKGWGTDLQGLFASDTGSQEERSLQISLLEM